MLDSIATGIIGAASAAIPLYFLYRTKILEIRQQQAKVVKEELEVEKQAQIDNEAEWKRIIDMYATDSSGLRVKIEELDKKYNDLLNRFIQSEKESAGKDEQIKLLTIRVDKLTELLLNRCPECPSLKNSTKPISVNLSLSSPEATKT